MQLLKRLFRVLFDRRQCQHTHYFWSGGHVKCGRRIHHYGPHRFQWENKETR